MVMSISLVLLVVLLINIVSVLHYFEHINAAGICFDMDSIMYIQPISFTELIC